MGFNSAFKGLTPNVQFWGCAIIAFSEQYVIGISDFLECLVALNRNKDWIRTAELQITMDSEGR
jgi:hypothetical protein